MNTITKDSSGTKEVARRFSKAASHYHEKAEIQKKVAQGLISSLIPWKAILPEGPILEIGCGTGFLSQLLIREFPDRELLISDVSEGMLRFAEERLRNDNMVHEHVQFKVLDAEQIQPEEGKYSLIISNFSAQWFSDTAYVLEKLSECLLPGGLMLCSFPGNQSFTEWYECCLELGLPFTANSLPDVEEVVIKLSVGPMQIDYYENDLYQEFDHSLDFFRHLKEIGASFSKTGKSLSRKQMKLLIDFWDKKASGPVKSKWHVVYLAAKKDNP